jgi:hypothetical protein
MNLIHAGRKYIFHLNPSEMLWLRAVLDRYPVIPPRHQRLSKGKQDKTSQHLLDDALAEQRRENRKLLDALLASEKHLREIKAGFRLSLAATEMEWLLQVLNDVRIGSWILLGSPEGDLRALLENEKTAPLALMMEMSGHFQSELLTAFRQSR